MSARPIDFNKIDGVPIEPIKFETTCPACGMCVAFARDAFRIANATSYVECPHCHVDYKPKIEEAQPPMRNFGQTIVAPTSVQPPIDGNPFGDPIDFDVNKMEFA